MGDERKAAQASDEALKAAPQAPDDASRGVGPPARVPLRAAADVVHCPDDERCHKDGTRRGSESKPGGKRRGVCRWHAFCLCVLREIPATDAYRADCEDAIFEVCCRNDKQKQANPSEEL